MGESAGQRNVLFVAYEFPPQGGVGVQRSTKFAKYLPEHGYRPLVLTVAEKNIHGVRDDSLLAELAGTKVFPCCGQEYWLEWLPRRMRLHRLISFWLRPDTNVLAWLPAAKRAARRIATEHPIDVIYTSVSPYSSALLGRRLKRLLGVPWVVDFRDPWIDDSSYRVWPTKLHYWFEMGQERRILESADAIVVVTPTMKSLLCDRYPQWTDKIHVICNGFDPSDFPSKGTGEQSPQLRIGFAGMFREYNVHAVGKELGPITKAWLSLLAYRNGSTDLSTGSPYYLLRAVRDLLDERPELEDAIRFSFAGIFGQENMKLVEQLRLQKVVTVKGYLSHAEASRLLTESDVLFFPLMSPEDGRRSYNYSGKAFEYLGTRKPILAAVPKGDAWDLIERSRAGWLVDPYDIGGMKSILLELIEKKRAGNLRTCPDETYIRGFERRNLTRQLAELFDSLL